ncbi:toxin-antitoxin system YwqK family antitoxin, partial [Fulvivirga kasyanovii]|nr:hypothetical protein [Fulvivirga kasyanovii]
MRINIISPLFTVVFLISCNIDITNKTPKEVDYQELNFKDGKGYYEDNLYTGIVVTRHANGEKKFESDFVKGLDNGQFKEWDEDGHLIEKSNSKKGKLHGKYVRYYPNGQKHFETTYKEG